MREDRRTGAQEDAVRSTLARRRRLILARPASYGGSYSGTRVRLVGHFENRVASSTKGIGTNDGSGEARVGGRGDAILSDGWVRPSLRL
jgi:hypothetical protein